MKIKIKLANLGMLAVALLAIIAFMQVAVTAVDLGQTEINVTVTDLSEVTIVPTMLNFSAAPGAQSTEVSLDIKNTGSNNVTNIYASVDTVQDETSNPIPAGDSANFASSGFLVLKNSSDTEFYYAGRLEWNLTTPATSASFSTPRNATGWYRNASGSYLWELGNGTEGAGSSWCNGSTATFEIEADTDSGTQATRTPAVAGNLDESVPDWGLFSFSSGPLTGQCVATYWDCTKIYIYHWDMNTTFDGCINSAYVKGDVALVPGNIETITAQAFVSEGVPDGVLKQSTLTIHGTAA